MDEQNKKLAVEAIDRIESGLKILRTVLDTPASSKPSVAESKPKFLKKPKQPKFYATSLPADQLGPIPDLNNDQWPIAVDPALICPQEGDSEKHYRALQIVALMHIPLTEKVVLDCGCGEGFNANEMANAATKVVGYDINQDKNWEARAKDNLVLTTSKSTVEENNPYDLIVLYDVIDHLQGEDPEQFVKWISSLLSKTGRVFIRTHPWTSRTGGHLYEMANKAWLHLALTPDELAKEGIVAKEPNLRIIRPMAAYELWFKNAGLVIDNKQVKTDEAGKFLDDEIIDRIIKVSWGGEMNAAMAKRIMQNSWIDYTLKK